MDDKVVYEGDTALAHYQVVDAVYSGRRARVLYSGDRQAAQSGVAKDGKPELLFNYNERLRELVRGLKPQNILLIGGGVLTLPMTLTAEFSNLLIDVVELDGGLLKIAKKYFSFKPPKGLNVYIGDGLDFLQKSRQAYDLIILDIFWGSSIPRAMQTADAAKLLQQHLISAGVVAINLISGYYGERSQTLRRQTEALQAAFSNIKLFPASYGESLWLPQNFILVAQNTSHQIERLLRFAPLNLPT